MTSENQKEIKALKAELVAANKQVEKLQQQLEDRKYEYHHFFDNINDAVAILDGDKFVDLNIKALELFGLENKEQASGLTVADISHGGDTDDVKSQIKKQIKAATEGEPQYFEWLVKQPDGTILEIEVSLSTFLSRDGVPYLMGIARDMSHRVRIENELRQQKNTLRTVLNAIKESICIVDKDFNVLFINETMANRFNTPIDQIIHTPIVDWLPEEVAEERVSYAHKLLKTGKEQYFEDVRSDRSIMNFLYPIVDKGEVTQIVALGVDVTEKKEIQSELKQLKQAIESSPSTVVITDVEGITQYVNPAFTTTTGFTKEEALGQKANLVRSTIHGQEFFEEMWTTIKSGGFWRGEICNKRKNGELFWELVSISPIINGDNKVTNYVAIKEDISNKKDLEQLKADIDRMMRHDLKTPLNSLIGIPQLLELEGGLSSNQQELVSAIEDAGRRMLRMIDLSLTLFQMESGTYKYQPQDIDALMLMNKVINDSKSKLSAKHLETEIELKSDSAINSFLVRAERDLLYSVLSSFLINGIEASPSNEKITVSLEDGANKTIRFKNKGVVPEKVRDHFFGKYKKLEREERNLGLDLYSTKLFSDTMELQLAMNTSDVDNFTIITLVFPQIDS